MGQHGILRQGAMVTSAIVLSLLVRSTATAQSVYGSGNIQQAGFMKKSKGCSSCESGMYHGEIITSPAPSSQEAPAPGTMPAPLTEAPAPSDFDLSSSMETASSPTSLAPNMMGDFLGYSSSSGPSGQAVVRGLTRYKIADNTSPIPRGRVYYTYNYFQDAFNSDTDIHRNLGGAEIPFFENRFSVDIRQGLNTFRTPGDVSTQANDLATTFKALLFRTDSLFLSSGMGVMWPTGPSPQGYPGGNAILSPFVGYLFAPENSDFFLQGFQQLDFPMQSEDQIVMHSDIGAGFWLRRNADDSFITAIAPTAELHLYTPLGDAPSGALTGLDYSDVLNATLGTTFVLRNQATLALGVGIPLSDRKDYDIEAQVQFNWFFGGSLYNR